MSDAADRFEGAGFVVEILRDRTPVTFVYVERDARLEVPRHARKLVLSYRALEELGLADRIEVIASAFWTLRERGHIEAIEISYRVGDPSETVLLRPVS
jgi:hypothetical protein